jgi:hypothetical protein
MNKLTKAIMVIATLLAGLFSGPVSAAKPALASTLNDPSCPSSSPHSFVGWLWARSGNDIFGMRAPVQTRFDGLLCTNSAGDAFATGWIAIEANDSSGRITQIGIIHHFRSGSAAWCRVWAVGTGVPNFYDCGDQSSGTYVYFMITQYSNTMGNFYDIQDCGTSGGYGNCSVDSASQPAYTDPLGVVAAENNYPCTVQIMGSASAPQNYGTSSSPIEGLVNDWGPRTWGYQSQDNFCPSDYRGAQASGSTSSTISTWDSRN